jgi:hypothetical protein
MRSVFTIVAVVLLSACTSQPQPTTVCTEPRSMVCTREFRPTCAVLAAGGTKEFASPCTACSDKAVSGYIDGPCPE